MKLFTREEVETLFEDALDRQLPAVVIDSDGNAWTADEMIADAKVSLRLELDRAEDLDALDARKSA